MTTSGSSVADNSKEERGSRTDRLYHSSISKTCKAWARAGTAEMEPRGMHVQDISEIESTKLSVCLVGR